METVGEKRWKQLGREMETIGGEIWKQLGKRDGNGWGERLKHFGERDENSWGERWKQLGRKMDTVGERYCTVNTVRERDEIKIYETIAVGCRNTRAMF